MGTSFKVGEEQFDLVDLVPFWSPVGSLLVCG